MTYQEMIEVFNEYGLQCRQPVANGYYPVYYKCTKFCFVEKHKKLNRSLIILRGKWEGTIIRDVTVQDLRNKISDYQKKYKETELKSKLKNLDEDF